jgi:hypothetical protein
VHLAITVRAVWPSAFLYSVSALQWFCQGSRQQV